MKFLNSKRGNIEEYVMTVLIELVIVLIVFASVFIFIHKSAQTNIFEKRFLSKDMALAIDALYAGPGNSIITYSDDTFELSFDFKGSKVGVYDNSDEIGKILDQKLKSGDLFTGSSTLKLLEEPLLYSKQARVIPVFSKIGDKIIIKDRRKFDYNLNEVKCYRKGFNLAGMGNILLRDPSDKQIEGIARSLLLLQPLFSDVDSTKGDVFNDEGQVVIHLRRSGGDNIKAFISSGSERFYESKGLACSIINNLLENKELKAGIKGASVALTGGVEGTLKKMSVAVLLEIGEKVLEGKKPEQVASSINQGIEEAAKNE